MNLNLSHIFKLNNLIARKNFIRDEHQKSGRSSRACSYGFGEAEFKIQTTQELRRHEGNARHLVHISNLDI